MANDNETLADIVAELRGRADGAFPYDVDAMNMLEPLADRIEAAAERAEDTVGNAAAMREALESCYRIIHCAMVTGLINRDDANKAMDAYHSALSSPARNCDRFADELDAQLAFLNEVWLISIDRETMTEQDTYEKWTDEMRTRYGRWLFAPATERKGEGDGR